MIHTALTIDSHWALPLYVSRRVAKPMWEGDTRAVSYVIQILCFRITIWSYA